MRLTLAGALRVVVVVNVVVAGYLFARYASPSENPGPASKPDERDAMQSVVNLMASCDAVVADCTMQLRDCRMVAEGCPSTCDNTGMLEFFALQPEGPPSDPEFVHAVEAELNRFPHLVYTLECRTHACRLVVEPDSAGDALHDLEVRLQASRMLQHLSRLHVRGEIDGDRRMAVYYFLFPR